ncbi:MAG: ABC-type transport auxiliary lipoprotein family protein [Pseudomonadota bacterium]
MIRTDLRRVLGRALAAAALSAGLSGCAGINALETAAQPTDLYLLTPKSSFDPSLPTIREQLVVDLPTATAAVNTNRIAVQPNPLEVKYLPGVSWVDRAPVIVQALMIESFENSGKVGAVGRSNVDLRADYIIVTDIREFQAVVAEDAGPERPLEVHVRVNLKIIDAEEDRIIASRSFERYRLAESDAMLDIATAFDDALGGVMRRAVEWSVEEMAARPIAGRRRQFF